VAFIACLAWVVVDLAMASPACGHPKRCIKQPASEAALLVVNIKRTFATADLADGIQIKELPAQFGVLSKKRSPLV
jgi:hypothetical protein